MKKKIKETFEWFDFFAAPVTLTYKGKKDHPTCFGGILSIVYLLTCGGFLILNIDKCLFIKGDNYT